MSPVPFGGSERGTLGLEWELALVDLETRELSGRAHEVLDAVGATDDGPIRGEYLATMVELVSGVHPRVGDAVAELSGHLDVVQDAAASLGLGVLAAGTHPFSVASEQQVVDKPHYEVVKQRNGWWGRRMIVSGTHIHVGVPRHDWAMPLVGAMARLYPLVLAASASSPFFEGEDTGFASQRTMLFQQLATNGLPWDLGTWAEFEAYADELVEVGMITVPTEIRWDIRPAPKFGTVENRVPDASPTLGELGCVAAWTQCIAEYTFRELDAGRHVAPLPQWLLRENKFRTARYGLDATVITPEPGRRQQPLRDVFGVWLGRLGGIAAELGCADELALAGVLLDEGASYERQRAVAAAHDGDLVAVVDALLEETRTGRRWSPEGDAA